MESNNDLKLYGKLTYPEKCEPLDLSYKKKLDHEECLSKNKKETNLFDVSRNSDDKINLDGKTILKDFLRRKTTSSENDSQKWEEFVSHLAKKPKGLLKIPQSSSSKLQSRTKYSSIRCLKHCSNYVNPPHPFTKTFKQKTNTFVTVSSSNVTSTVTTNSFTGSNFPLKADTLSYTPSISDKLSQKITKSTTHNFKYHQDDQISKKSPYQALMNTATGTSNDNGLLSIVVDPLGPCICNDCEFLAQKMLPKYAFSTTDAANSALKTLVNNNEGIEKASGLPSTTKDLLDL